jgi:hypothetical protein
VVVKRLATGEQLLLFEPPKSLAIFSDRKRYRYVLSREWPAGKGLCLFILLNPSTADAETNDPTTRRCIGYAQRWGFSALNIVNLFALRATDPERLYRARDPVGPDNNRWILERLRAADLVVCGWGNHGAHRARDARVLMLIKSSGKEPHALGLTRNSRPVHPLRQPKSALPKPLSALVPRTTRMNTGGQP